MAVITPYDKGSLTAIEKAIRDTDLGVNPTNDGTSSGWPSRSSPRSAAGSASRWRAHKAEDARVSIRNIRRHAKDALDKLAKDGEAGEDDVRRAEKELDETHPPVRRARSTSCSSTRKPSCSRSDEPGEPRRERADQSAPSGSTGRGAPRSGRAQPAGRRRASASALGALVLVAAATPCKPVFVGRRRRWRSWSASTELSTALRQHAASTLPLHPARASAPVAILVCGVRGRAPTALIAAFALTVAAAGRLAARSTGRTGYLRGRLRRAASCRRTSPFLAGFAALMLAGRRRRRPGHRSSSSTVVASDIGGYAAGVLFGKHPMAPTISPKKSWEGFAGSVVCARSVGGVAVHVAAARRSGGRACCSALAVVSPRRSATSASR